MKRDGNLTSLWQNTKSSYRPGSSDLPKTPVDAVIVGGGITGITTALALQRAGRSCVVCEAQTLGFGTTGGTTAHLNTFFDTTYAQVIKDFGESNAKLLATAAQDAIDHIKNNISTFKIDCDFEKKEGYVFAVEEVQNEELEKLVEATKKMDLPMEFANDSAFPVPFTRIATIAGQAQFNPIEYLHGLAKAFTTAGGIILENCRVTGLKDENPLTVETSMGNIKANKLLYATHIPPGVNLLHFRCAPYRSYVIACKLASDNYPDAVGYDICDPYHYYRTQKLG
ncbi:MAG TPA: FAD-binding oxidoreductase, partial [Ferruginibacter sp.]|nr:FAD-binding oxidoreductase [Ferruginibacter sp.]